MTSNTYLASGATWITDAWVGLFRVTGDLAGEQAISLLDRLNVSFEKCKRMCYIEHWGYTATGDNHSIFYNMPYLMCFTCIIKADAIIKSNPSPCRIHCMFSTNMFLCVQNSEHIIISETYRYPSEQVLFVSVFQASSFSLHLRGYCRT